jgi:hypothetical protein
VEVDRFEQVVVRPRRIASIAVSVAVVAVMKMTGMRASILRRRW